MFRASNLGKYTKASKLPDKSFQKLRKKFKVFDKSGFRKECTINQYLSRIINILKFFRNILKIKISRTFRKFIELAIKNLRYKKP